VKTPAWEKVRRAGVGAAALQCQEGTLPSQCVNCDSSPEDQGHVFLLIEVSSAS
jgi:hypothetical protein